MKETTVKTETSTAPFQPLAIVGMGCLFPKAENLGAYWANIKNGVDAITEIPPTHWQVENYFDSDQKAPDRTYGKRGGFISPIAFNPMTYNLPPNTLEAIDTSQLLGLVAAGQALSDAGYGPDRTFNREKVSVILGVTGALELVIPLGARLGHPLWRAALKEAGVEEAVAEDVISRISESYVPWQENSFPGLLGNVVAGRISKHFDLGGTNCVVDAACASSLSAMHLAAMELACGRADMVVSGGVDTFNDIFMYMCFSKTPALSPSGNAKPFDADGDGTILGEGLGIMVLKRLADAERDGDRIYAVIRGIGSSSDGKGDAIYAPSAAGQKKALLEAYRQAAVTPQTIQMVEAHGTGTKVGDAVEVSALREVYGEAVSPWCALGSVKSQIGHTKAAAGSAGIIKAALSLYNKVLPPTIKVHKPLPEITTGSTPFYLNTMKRPWLPNGHVPRRAAVSAFGFGGSNFHCVLEEHRGEKSAADWDGDVQVLALSGETPAAVIDALSAIKAESEWGAVRAFAASSRKSFRSDAPCRLVVVAERGKTNFGNLVASVRAMFSKDKQGSWSTPDGAFYASGPVPGKLGCIFPGQGAQYVGMLRDLACHFPEMVQVLEEADAAYSMEPSAAGRLSDLIYPPASFDQHTSDEQERSLRATDVAQPAIGAVSLGVLQVLSTFGITPEAAAGHSYGELTALCAAGRFDADALHMVSRLRGQLMAEGEGDKGGMLAVSAPIDTVADLLREEKIDLVLANKNSPSQAVLSGRSEDIGRAAKILASRNIPCKPLPVAAAFHSPLVAEASAPFRARLEGIPFMPSQIPVFSNTTADEYPDAADDARQLLADQLAAPVEFVREVENMFRAGVRTFVEVGPGARLTGLVKAILGDKEYEAVAVDASGGKRSGLTDLARVLAQLAALGYGVRLSEWDASFRSEPADVGKKPAMTIPLSGANYMKPRPRRPAVSPVSRPAAAAAVPAPAMGPAPVAPLAQESAAALLRLTQENMGALQRLQEQTAQLHRQFLEGQEAAGRTFQALLQQQQNLFTGGAGSPTVPFSAPTAAIARPSAPAMPPPAVTAPVVPASRPAASPLQSTSASSTASVLFEVVSEKTGYPVEMLDLDMGLDADLGIDSIKRVEILSALQERLPSAPAVTPEEMGTLQTLRQIVLHLGEGGTAGVVSVTAPVQPIGAGVATDMVTSTLIGVISDKTGYPSEMLDLDMSLDSDLGIDSIKRVEILSAIQERLPNAPSVTPEEMGTLQTLRQIVQFLSAGATVPGAPAAGATSAGGGISPAGATDALLSVISEKTGYPVEMLELDMTLDADLGIDSIKRVEILSALQEQLPGAPAVTPEELGRLQTLRQIVEHLAAAPASLPATFAAAPASEAGIPGEVATAALLEVISDKTGYPVEMLELDMSLDADLGIDSIKRVEILSAIQEKLPAAPAVTPDQMGSLQTLRQIAEFLAAGGKGKTAAAAASSEAKEASVPDAGPSKGVDRSALKAIPASRNESPELTIPLEGEIWITDDGAGLAFALADVLRESSRNVRVVSVDTPDEAELPEALRGLVLLAPSRGTDDTFIYNAFNLLKCSAGALRKGSAEGSFLVTVSRLDGEFGCSGDALSDPLSGGISAFAKTASHEWQGVHCKAIDLADDFDSTHDAARAIAAEMCATGAVEVGLSTGGRFVLTLVPAPLGEEVADIPMMPGELVIISGGARGVTAEVAVGLARSCRPTLVLLGRSPEPVAEPAWLASLTDDAAIKRELVKQLPQGTLPKRVEEEFRSILANREMVETLTRISSTGATVLYRSVDIRNAEEVAALVSEIRAEYGPVRGIVHGAGVLADRLIADQTREQFEQVYGTKVEGLRNLLAAAGDDDLRFLALFSSSTGRFGRTGQVAYGVANEVLNKTARSEASRRRGCRVVAINWGPWDGGMVTPALKKVFAAEGVEVIGLSDGTDCFLHEIALPPGEPVETVVLGKKGDAADLSSEPSQSLSEAVSLELTVEKFPFLRSHVMNGRGVLPLAMIAEWLAHGALHGNPGLRFHGFENLKVMKGVVLEQGIPCAVKVMAGKPVRKESLHHVPVELRGARGVLHARGEIVLASTLPEGTRSVHDVPQEPYPCADEAIYTSDRLFHGPDFRGIEHVIGCNSGGIAATVKGAPAPSGWILSPLRTTWVTDPLALDAAFQMMILWSLERFGAGSLPTAAGRYRQFQEQFPREGTEILIRITEEGNKRAVALIEFLDRQTGKLVARLEQYECVIDESLRDAFRKNNLITGDAPERGAA